MLFRLITVSGLLVATVACPSFGDFSGDFLASGDTASVFGGQPTSIFAFNSSGALQGTFASFGSGVNFVDQMTIGPDGNLYVDTSNISGYGFFEFNPKTGALIDNFRTLSINSGSFAFAANGNLLTSYFDFTTDTNYIYQTNLMTNSSSVLVSQPASYIFQNIAVANGMIFTTDINQDNVQVFNATTGAFIKSITSNSTLSLGPSSMLTGPDGNVYFSDGDGHIYQINSSTLNETTFSTQLPSQSSAGLAFGSNGDLFGSNTRNSELLDFNSMSGSLNGTIPLAVPSPYALEGPIILDSAPLATVPEPTSLALLAFGLASLVVLSRRRG